MISKMANAVHVHSEEKYKFVRWADIVFLYVFQIKCKLNPFISYLFDVLN